LEIKSRISAYSCAASLVEEQNYLLTLTMAMSDGGGDDVVKFIDVND
jgi:hypothetical protein